MTEMEKDSTAFLIRTVISVPVAGDAPQFSIRRENVIGRKIHTSQRQTSLKIDGKHSKLLQKSHNAHKTLCFTKLRNVTATKCKIVKISQPILVFLIQYSVPALGAREPCGLAT